ncbi:MAG: ATP-binding cassette domain-containing protein [Actinobacteria bacterium]|nr:ATP-binding cassette domain-containing protein [Actinomycetota bacterium]
MEAVRNFGRATRSTVRIDALKNVTFDVQRGAVTGVIGANGAGKSTLLRAIGGIVPPSSGEIRIRGNVGALLSLGVGFNQNLSGRENVMLGGLASGLSRAEINEYFDSIVDFADLWDHIDMPMRTYSSGMFSRLGFAVATTMNPEILLIDEALSTGDARFKEKSSQRIEEMREKAGAMMIVSHALGTIQELCSDTIWLHHGEVIMRDTPERVTEAYMKFLDVGNVAAVMEDF